MLKMVDGTGIIGVDMICPLGVSTPQPPNYDRVELEGTGMLVLPNSLDAPLERLELGGKTEQVTTTGVNLFDEKLLLDFDSKNYDKTQSGSGFYYYKFPANGTVAVSTKNANKNGEYLTVGIKPDGSDKTWLSHGSAAISKYKTLTPEDGNIYLGVNNNLERVKSIIQNTGGIIINEGSVAKPYEPYTVGKPSPSPEYPQEIKNVGKWNEETQKYEVDVKITNAEQNWSKEQSITLTSDRPLTKWDRLVEQGGEIGWLYASKKYVITGNEFFEYRSGYDQDAYTNRFIVINDLFVNRLSDKQLAYCKILKRVQYIYAQNKLEEGIDTNVNQLHIKLSNDRIGVLSSDDTETRTAKIAEYIKNTYTDGIEILYATTDTVFLPLPQSEQNAIRALKTYYPTTAITADGGELDPDIKVTYRKEI